MKTTSRQFVRTIVCTLICGLLGFSAGAQEPKAAKPADLVGTSWTLVSIKTAEGETPLPEKINITLKINAEGHISGNAGVNRYFGSLSGGDGKVSWSPMGSTRMAGDRGRMAAEHAFLSNLAKTTAYAIKDGSVTFSDEATKIQVVLTAAKD